MFLLIRQTLKIGIRMSYTKRFKEVKETKEILVINEATTTSISIMSFLFTQNVFFIFDNFSLSLVLLAEEKTTNRRFSSFSSSSSALVVSVPWLSSPQRRRRERKKWHEKTTPTISFSFFYFSSRSLFFILSLLMGFDYHLNCTIIRHSKD